jgi:hypothetical protein
MNCITLGIDLAKQVCQLHGADERGQVVVQKRVIRSKLRATIAQFPACVLTKTGRPQRLLDLVSPPHLLRTG